MKYFIAIIVCVAWLGMVTTLRIGGHHIDFYIELSIDIISVVGLCLFSIKIFNLKKRTQSGRYWPYFVLEMIRMFSSIGVALSFILLICSKKIPIHANIIIGTGIPIMFYVFLKSCMRFVKYLKQYQTEHKIDIDEKYL